MKYMGSKNRIAKDILPIILKDREPDQWYVEPFVGGCNIIDKVDGLRWGNDSNEYLIAMWIALQNGWKPDKITKEQYTHIRNNIETTPKHIVGWVGFNCSYSGKYFGGFAGSVKTKVNTIRDYQQEALKNIEKQIPQIKDIIYTDLHYWNLELPKNSIIYCDPPYQNTTSYKESFDHNEFWNWCRKKVEDGHKVFISEYNAPEDFIEIWRKEVKSSLSANGKVGGNKNSIEKLFVHKSTNMDVGY